ncbi:hypothetical protein SE19_08735, partial [Acidiplasma aeolicum]
SDKCSIEFQRKYDYSKNSKILKEYRQQLIDMEKIEKPDKEINPVSTPVARKTYKCILCGLDINKGDRYYKYVRLPGYDEWFDEAPYEVAHYHLNCMAFFKLLVDAGMGDDEGFVDDWIPTIYYAFALETNQDLLTLKKNIIAGNFPSRDVIEEISKEYEDLDPFYWFYVDNSPYKYIYSVKFIAYGRTMAEIHISYKKLKDPEEFFKNYYIEERIGDEFSEIKSIKFLKVPIKNSKPEVEH